MKPAKKRCEYCGRWYEPDPHTAGHQKACSRPECRLERRRQKYRSWIKRHPWHVVERRPKNQAWAAAYPDYWRKRRAEDADYRAREKRRMRIKRLRARRVAKQTASARIAVEKLQGMRRPGAKTVAKQTALSRRVDAVVEFLFWKEGVAKQTDIAPAAGAGP